MMFVDVLLEAVLKAYGGMAVIFVVLTAIELTFRRGSQSLALRKAGLGFWIIAIPISAFMATALSWLWATLGVTPILQLEISREIGLAGPVGWVLGPLLGALVGDFFGYWYHRIQHKWLWPIHAVHHSIRDLSAINSYHHASDALFTTALVTLPTTLIVVSTGNSIAVMTLFLLLQPTFLHSPSSLHFGPLRHVIADNRYHRIHHSVEPRHFDKNFAILFSFWDRLFGTAYDPAPDEWPEVGLAEVNQPNGLREWLDLPLRLGGGGSDTPIESTQVAAGDKGESLQPQ